MTLPVTELPVLAPSILSADFAHLARDVERVEEAGAGLLHVDVMDGRYVPNLTIGLPVVRSLRKATDTPLDVHLMIVEPDRWVTPFVDAGADMVSVHVEAAPHLHYTLSSIRAAGAAAGVAINPGTPVDFLRHVANLLDYVLVMSVNPGWGGQQFISEALPKVGRVRRLLDEVGASGVAIEVDGGLGPENVEEVVRAGAGILVCGSSVFRTSDPTEAARRILDHARQGVS